MKPVLLLLLITVLVRPVSVLAETGHETWLRYQHIEGVGRSYDRFPAVVITLGDTPILKSCREELLRGLRGMLGRIERIEPIDRDALSESAVMLGTLASIKQLDPTFSAPTLRGD